ncbi:helix-turn-helix domain-containing protein [Thermobifida halotolerans]|uniref:helix-turn-helix domain-containing protein n=1 Tax=Thermobifida halotolerans TaxID=483545 RepID=UPI000837D980|nr:helix-turn-helix transcriptional regulator [Thermobifida halotolerans]
MASSPTLRRRRLSSLLREAREKRGLTAKWVADQAKERSGRERGWSESKLNRLESGVWKRVRAEDINVLLDIYGITGPDERTAYLTLVREATQKGWWAAFGDVLGSGEFVGLEAEASRIRTFESAAVPGLLQTEDYARALMSDNELISDAADLDRRVQARMLRKQVLSQSTPPDYQAVIDEAALLRVTPELSAQLDHLLEIGARPAVDIRVLPLTRGPYTAMTGQLVIMDFSPPNQPVVYLEALAEEIYLDKPEEISRYRRIYDYLRDQALSADASRELIRNLLASLQERRHA